MAPAANAPSIQQQNLIARQMILAQSVEMTQSIFTSTVVPANQNVINIVPRNVGLITGFLIELTATITNTAGAGLTLTDFNAANLLSQVTFTDLNNNVRVNTTGWHLEFIDTAKRGRVWGSSSATDSPIKYGSNWTVISASSTIAASGTGTVTMRYWLPLAYDRNDLRGAVYGNVVNATMNLQLTLAQTAAIATGDTTSYIYTGNPATVTSCTVNVYQMYRDQLPMGQKGPVLPLLDLSTVYELKNTTFTGIVANQEFAAQLSNFRDFLSQTVVYYNGTARASGTDINYWALQSANFTNIWKISPQVAALRARNIIQTDFPPGVYYFDHRHRPLSTTSYGNMELILNPSTAGAGSYLLIGYEDMALMNTINQAGSLAS